MTSTNSARSPDRKPSIRILLATRLVQAGIDPAEVAARCAVPLALLEFITDLDAGPTDDDAEPVSRTGRIARRSQAFAHLTPVPASVASSGLAPDQGAIWRAYAASRGQRAPRAGQ